MIRRAVLLAVMLPGLAQADEEHHGWRHRHHRHHQPPATEAETIVAPQTSPATAPAPVTSLSSSLIPMLPVLVGPPALLPLHQGPPPLVDHTTRPVAVQQSLAPSAPPSIAPAATVTPVASLGPALRPSPTPITTITPPQTCIATAPFETPLIPYAPDSIFNRGLGRGAQWAANGQLNTAGVNVNAAGPWDNPIYAGASDPLVTVTVGTPPGTYQIHIPASAQPSPDTDGHLTVADLATGTWGSFSNAFRWTDPNSATAGLGGVEPLGGNGLGMQNSNWDFGVGTIMPGDLNTGINHMLRISVPRDMLLSVSNSPDVLCAYCWPQSKEDYAGPQTYTGTIPYGATIGIPQGTPEPADVRANPGAHLLWQELQTYGAMIRDSGGGPGAHVINFYTDQNVSSADPKIAGMRQFGNEIMAATRLLTNQGPNSVNGGGDPVVPIGSAAAALQPGACLPPTAAQTAAINAGALVPQNSLAAALGTKP